MLRERHTAALRRDKTVDDKPLSAREREEMLRPVLPDTPSQTSSASSPAPSPIPSRSPSKRRSPAETTGASVSFDAAATAAGGATSSRPTPSARPGLAPSGSTTTAAAAAPATATAAKPRRAAPRRRKPIRTALKQILFALSFALVHFLFSVWARLRRGSRRALHRAAAVALYHHRTPELIRADARALAKRPRHVSVVLRLDPAEDRRAALRRLLRDVGELAAWCAAVGVRALTVYERTGILKQSVPVAYSAVNATLGHYFGAGKRPVLKVRVPHTLDFSPPTTPPPEAEAAADDGDEPARAPLAGPVRPIEPAEEADDLDFDDDDENRPPPVINVLLISEVDGRTTMVDLTKILTEMAQKKKLKPADINADLIDMELRDSVMTEPELLILFGPRVVLDGYPPWQIRLTEILCVPLLVCEVG
jgi:dehydrodolichyl diphosphate syntase complex subunit NUS1